MSNPKRPRDPNQKAKLIVDIATGEVKDVDPDEGKDPAAVSLGRKGGKKGERPEQQNYLQKSVKQLLKKQQTVGGSRTLTRKNSQHRSHIEVVYIESLKK